MLTFQPKSSSVSGIVRVLARGGLVIAPSDTVYGLLVDATNEEAVKKLIAFKNRPWGKPISVFVADKRMIDKYADVNEKNRILLEELLPGPFTIVLPSKHNVSSLLESEKGTLGVRLPSHSFINELVQAFGKPVTATSANISGRPPHYQLSTLFNELSEQKKKLVDAVVDGKKLKRNKPSTIIDLTGEKLKILRKGDIVFSSSKTYITKSPAETRKLARYLMKKFPTNPKDKPAVFILQGNLGTGKTEFVRGAAEIFNVEKIISPTYVIYYEYIWGHKKDKKFVHADLYNLQHSDEFAPLGLDQFLKPGNVMFIEWGEKIGDAIDSIRPHAKLIWIKLRHLNENERELVVES